MLSLPPASVSSDTLLLLHLRLNDLAWWNRGSYVGFVISIIFVSSRRREAHCMLNCSWTLYADESVMILDLYRMADLIPKLHGLEGGDNWVICAAETNAETKGELR